MLGYFAGKNRHRTLILVLKSHAICKMNEELKGKD
jgi:hypothetical protein